MTFRREDLEDKNELQQNKRNSTEMKIQIKHNLNQEENADSPNSNNVNSIHPTNSNNSIDEGKQKHEINLDINSNKEGEKPIKAIFILFTFDINFL